MPPSITYQAMQLTIVKVITLINPCIHGEGEVLANQQFHTHLSNRISGSATDVGKEKPDYIYIRP